MDWLDQIVSEVETRRAGVSNRAFVVGIAGGVAAGKSRIAEALAEALRAAGLSVEIVGTDGFLLSNAQLTERGLMDRKGFPESYDWTGVAGLLAAVADGAGALTAPTYSHERYDVDAPRAFSHPDVLILEGLIALDARVRPLDLGLYVEADETDLIRWYVERFMRLERWKAPRLTKRLAAVGGDPEALARDIWDRINAPNLRDHIAPSRARADLILRKGPDHSVQAVTPA